jgi:hypothetical protein
MALRRPITVRSYPSPMGPGFDDSNRESYIARSNQGIASLPRSNVIVDYNLGRGGRDPSMIGGFGLGPSGLMDPVTEVPAGGPVGMFGEDRSGTTLDMLLDDVFEQYDTPSIAPRQQQQGLQEMSGLFGPGPGLGDPTGEGGIIQRLGEFLGLTDPIDPENEGLPMDEFQDLLPEERQRIIKERPDLVGLTGEIAMDDTYSLPNLLQMIQDARDAGNVDELELLTNDLEMMYPGATTTI